MAVPDSESRIVELDDLVVRPGTYFNPQTEVVVVVDDSASIDQEVFNMEAYEGADWVLISDEVPVDSDALETAMQRFQTDYRRPPGAPLTDEIELDDSGDDLDGDEDGDRPEPEDDE